MARICTFSIISICFILYGFHTALAYSKCGLTRLVYNSLNVLASKYSKLVRITPSIELALLTFSFICRCVGQVKVYHQ